MLATSWRKRPKKKLQLNDPVSLISKKKRRGYKPRQQKIKLQMKRLRTDKCNLILFCSLKQASDNL